MHTCPGLFFLDVLLEAELSSPFSSNEKHWNALMFLIATRKRQVGHLCASCRERARYMLKQIRAASDQLQLKIERS